MWRTQLYKFNPELGHIFKNKQTNKKTTVAEQVRYLLCRNHQSSSWGWGFPSFWGWCWTASASRCPALVVLLRHFLYRIRGLREAECFPETPTDTCRFLRMEQKNVTSPCFLFSFFSSQSFPFLSIHLVIVMCELSGDSSSAHAPCRGRGQPSRTDLLTRMLRAAFTTACCPALRPQLLGDGRGDEGGG